MPFIDLKNYEDAIEDYTAQPKKADNALSLNRRADAYVAKTNLTWR